MWQRAGAFFLVLMMGLALYWQFFPASPTVSPTVSVKGELLPSSGATGTLNPTLESEAPRQLLTGALPAQPEKPPSPSPTPALPQPKASPPPVPRQPAPQYPQARSSNFVTRAEEASAQLDALIVGNQVTAGYVGTGHNGAMVSLSLFNPTRKTQRIRLVPGMILRPPDGESVQPLLVDEERTLVLKPGTHAYEELYSYCLDSRVPAPFEGEQVEYRFAPRTQEGGPQAVRVLQASRKFPVTYEKFRRAVIQLAIWKSLGQPVGERQIISVLGPDAAQKPLMREKIFDDVERLLLKSGQ